MAGARRLALIVGLLCGASTRTVAQDEPGWLPTRPAAEASADTCPSLAAAPLACPTPRCPGGPLHGWVSAEYVYGWIGGATPPPLLSAAPVRGGPPTVLFGDDPLNDDGRSGFQLRGGFWLDESGTYGVEAGTFLLCQSADRARAEDTPGTVIGRPFFNAQLGAPDV